MRLIWSRPSKRRWHRSFVACSAALGLLTGAAAAEDAPVAAIGDQPIAIDGAEGSGTLPAFSSRPLLARMPGVTRLLVMVHGAGRDADRAEAQAAAAIGAAADRTLVVAPQFLSAADVKRWTLPGDRLRWSGLGWAMGEPAAGPAPLSPFSVLDSLLRSLADPGLLPDLKAITLAGQGDGADLVQLYAAVTSHLTGLETRGIALRFVLAEPAHYLYLDQARPVPTEAAACPGFDRWPYGLDGAPAYLDQLGPARIFTQYRARDVVYLLGKPGAAGAEDPSCAAAAQGADRPARGRFFLSYLAKLAGAPLHRLAELPDAEGGPALLGSGCGAAALLDRPDCPALAAPPAVPPFPEPAVPSDQPVPAAAAAAAPAAAPAPPPPAAEPLPAPPPDQVDPGGLADPLHEADPIAPLLTRAPPKPNPPTTPPP